MYPPVPPLRPERIFGEGSGIRQSQPLHQDPAPPVACVGVVVGFPLLAYVPPNIPPAPCPVLAVVLVAESDSRRWWDGDLLPRQGAEPMLNRAPNRPCC